MEGFKALGEGTTIYPWAKIIKAEVIEIGPYSQIDDFVFIYGGKGIVLGRYVHIAPHKSYETERTLPLLCLRMH